MAACLLLSAAGYGLAQAPPAPPGPLSPQPFIGFVPPYEIMKTVREAGFNPLAPPLREGTTYVIRATDFRGILMRVVVDARTGAIRDANRIVPAGTYGLMEPPPYKPADFDAPVALPRPELELPSIHPAVPRATVSVPLPRPRPAALVSRKPADESAVRAKSQPPEGAASASTPTASGGGKPAGSSSPQINSEITTTVPPSVALPAPKKAAPAPPVELND